MSSTSSSSRVEHKRYAAYCYQGITFCDRVTLLYDDVAVVIGIVGVTVGVVVVVVGGDVVVVVVVVDVVIIIATSSTNRT